MMEEREEKRSQAEIFTRLRGGEAIPMDDPDYGQIRVAVNQTFDLLVKLNQCPDLDKVRAYLSEIIGQDVDESTTVFPPFHTNFGRHITLGKHVFINHACSFLDLGGIVIDDHVMIGPRVNISSENHPIEAAQRKTLVPGTVHIRQNAWIGAGATLLPGITIGENAVVAAGAVVTQNVAPNTVVGGVPARKIKETG